MIVIVIFNIIVVFFAYLAYRYRSNLFLKISFVYIFLFLALRYDFGNDYQNYLENFIAINQGVLVWESEPGWVLLCRLFAPFGFFAMVAFLAALQCVVYYRFFNRYVPAKYYWIALFLYLFNPGCLLILSSAMRQSVAIVIFIYAIDYIYKKDFVRYFFCVAIASTFHSSALILFPVYLIGLFDWKVNKSIAVVIFFSYLFMYLIINYLQAQMSQFIEIYFKSYEMYLDKDMNKIGTGFGFLFGLFVFALVLIKVRIESGDKVLILKIAILSYLVMPFSFINPMMTRIGMYFEPFMIIAFIAVLSLLKDANIRFSIIAMYSLIILLSFYGFFNSDIWTESFSAYKTVFSAPRIY